MKAGEVHQQIVKKYNLKEEGMLHKWITHYMADTEVATQIEIIDGNTEKLFGRELAKPDFKLEFPATLTKETYVQMLKKIFAGIRYEVYRKIRSIVRNREEKYLTKGEMKDILRNTDVQELRAKVFQLYGLPEPSPRHPSHKILQKAHYTFMIDKDYL